MPGDQVSLRWGPQGEGTWQAAPTPTLLNALGQSFVTLPVHSTPHVGRGCA